MRIRLIVLVVAVLLLGTFSGIGTYAWFTSRVQSNNNTFQAGTLVLETDDSTPDPLFYVEPQGIGDDYYIEQWYPGLTVGGRSWSIRNGGTLTAKITGISAEVTYDPSDTPAEAQQEFADNLLVTIEYNNEQIFSGYLSSLLDSTQQLTKNDGTPIIFAPGASRDFRFTAHLEETAGNEAQGINATITFIIHGTQVNAP